MRWDNKDILGLIGQVVDIRHGNQRFRSVYLSNVKLPRNDEQPITLTFITDRGQGEYGFIRGRGVSVVGTGEDPIVEEGYGNETLSNLAGDNG